MPSIKEWGVVTFNPPLLYPIFNIKTALVMCYWYSGKDSLWQLIGVEQNGLFLFLRFSR